eukprot:scaffold13150_cov125-Isochrysis_galbana.AAC.5
MGQDALHGSKATRRGKGSFRLRRRPVESKWKVETSTSRVGVGVCPFLLLSSRRNHRSNRFRAGDPRPKEREHLLPRAHTSHISPQTVL